MIHKHTGRCDKGAHQSYLGAAGLGKLKLLVVNKEVKGCAEVELLDVEVAVLGGDRATDCYCSVCGA